ncbi:Clavaminate synthase-like protein [Cantharellus anzutake]|uniref:Clavaminate synthase-like protein n=1 Tax=Cantharellus anzutake TaxID=1750568 RepID=UPI0019086D36|nr:Clavaminate synthase-like protein [Cantharellus anzutake]KAF8325171.1 Clavaminate synthase-like protein [Cantharellus anzutake]
MAAPHFSIPVIDFSPFRSGSDPTRSDVARKVVSAFKEAGFMYVKNHGIAEATISKVFKESENFFALQDDVKDPLAWRDPRANRGYTKIGREQTTNANDPAEIAALREVAPDRKESFEIGLETDPEFRNYWPPEQLVPDFRSTMIHFYDACHNLHMDIMRAIALGLGMDESYFDSVVNEAWHTLRLLNYPPVERRLLEGEGQTRAGAHSGKAHHSNDLYFQSRPPIDYGSITLLFQDDIGGLEIQNPYTFEYVPAPPISGTIVVNVGDLLARWSNDLLRSTMHRVVAPTRTGGDERLAPTRQSIAFFCNPNEGATVDCLPGCEGSEGPKYPKVNSGEYLVMRLSATYD